MRLDLLYELIYANYDASFTGLFFCREFEESPVTIIYSSRNIEFKRQTTDANALFKFRVGWSSKKFVWSLCFQHLLCVLSMLLTVAHQNLVSNYLCDIRLPPKTYSYNSKRQIPCYADNTTRKRKKPNICNVIDLSPMQGSPGGSVTLYSARTLSTCRRRLIYIVAQKINVLV